MSKHQLAYTAADTFFKNCEIKPESKDVENFADGWLAGFNFAKENILEKARQIIEDEEFLGV